jgi:tetratricopeptide (TPR) repeat protein
MKRYSYVWISVIAFFLIGAGVPPYAAEERTVFVTSAEEASVVADNLDEQTLFDVLLGEMAAQRGQMEIATEALSRAARRTRDGRLAERATLAALYAKRYEDARQAAGLWVELQPASADAREALATALLELNRLPEARRELEQVLAAERSRNNLDQALLRVAALVGRAGPRDNTVNFMRELIEPYSDVAAAQFALAHLAVRAGDLDAAEAAVDRALVRKPDWQDAALFKARILVSQKNTAGAQRYFEEFLKANPRATGVRLHYARHLIDQKQWEQARDQFKRVVGETPDDADTIYAVGLLALQTNRLDEAETYLKRVLTLRPDNDQVRIYLGQVLEQSKRYADAARWYVEIKSGEYYFEAQLRLAMVTAKQGNVPKARTLLKAIPAENDQQHVQRVLAEEQVLRDAKDFREALTLLNGALEQLPGEKDLLYARALVAERLNMLAVLESDLRTILERDPKNVNALNALGYTLADRTSRYGEAQALLLQAIEQKPDDPFVLDSIGWLRYRQGDNVEAIKYLKRALAIRSDAEIAAHLGEVLWVAGDRKEAESIWTRALHDTPDSETLRDVIKKFKQ